MAKLAAEGFVDLLITYRQNKAANQLAVHLFFQLYFFKPGNLLYQTNKGTSHLFIKWKSGNHLSFLYITMEIILSMEFLRDIQQHSFSTFLSNNFEKDKC